MANLVNYGVTPLNVYGVTYKICDSQFTRLFWTHSKAKVFYNQLKERTYYKNRTEKHFKDIEIIEFKRCL